MLTSEIHVSITVSLKLMQSIPEDALGTLIEGDVVDQEVLVDEIHAPLAERVADFINDHLQENSDKLLVHLRLGDGATLDVIETVDEDISVLDWYS
jgi:hypothetical protein